MKWSIHCERSDKDIAWGIPHQADAILEYLNIEVDAVCCAGRHTIIRAGAAGTTPEPSAIHRVRELLRYRGPSVTTELARR